MLKAINGLLLALHCAAPVVVSAQDAGQAPKAGAAAQSAPPPATQPPASPATPASPVSRPSASLPDESQARAIVQRADEIRFPKDTFQVDVLVTTSVGGQPQEPRRYRIMSKGSENTIIQTLEPVTERGQNLLMKGRELWVFMPSVSQPVRLSLAQRLTGQVANGDLARMSFADDYVPKAIAMEKIGGREHHVLELAAADRSTTYPKIVYWVRAGDFYPHKAEFYALSGRLLKACLFSNFQALGGRIRPTRLVMTDALKSGEESVLDYSGLNARDLPERMFTKDFLKRLD